MKLLLKDETDVLQCSNSYSLSPLHEATKNNRVKTIQLLLNTDKKQKLLKQRVYEGQTALHFVASQNHYEIIKILLDSDASLLARDRYRKTPLYAAVDRGANRTVELLLDREPIFRHFKNAFRSACMLGHTEVVSLFLRQKVKMQLLKCHSLKLKNSLLLAAAREQVATIKLLFNHCQKTLYKQNFMIELLHAVVESENLITARLFINIKKYRKILFISARRDETFVHYAARLDYIEILKLLLTHNTDLKMKDFNDQTALHYATKNKSNTVINVLLSTNVNLEVNDQVERISLLLALNVRFSIIADLLLKKETSKQLFKNLNNSTLRI